MDVTERPVIRQWCPTCQKATPTRILDGHELCARHQPPELDDREDWDLWDEDY